MTASAPTPDEWIRRYADEATRLGYGRGEVETLSTYARYILAKKGLVIFDPTHLSQLLGYKLDFLYSVANAPSRFYRTFSIPKKTGGSRQIMEPLPSLKEIQRWLLDNVLAASPVSPAAKAYTNWGGVKANARFHVRQPCILKMDLVDFFPSVHFSDVYDVFFSLGYTKSLSVLMAKLCTIEGRLPQGAPTSPAISNAVFCEIDSVLLAFSRERRFRYTRYADDICVSGDLDIGEVIRFVRKAVRRKGFKINAKKTRILRSGAQQIVTGVVVNEKLQAAAVVRRKFRQEVYYVRKYGVDGHLAEIGERRRNYLVHLIGVGNHILYLNPRDERTRRDVEYIHALISAYR